MKEDVMRFLGKMEGAGVRNYRRTADDRTHYVAFTAYDPKTDTVTEAGFAYRDYRLYIHQITLKLFMLIAACIVFFIVVYPLFFRGGLIQPLRALLNAVRRVAAGNLDVEVTAQNRDEIGLLSQNFNQMVIQLKESRDNILKSEEKYRRLSDQLPDIIYETDASLAVTYMNKAGFELTGYTREDIGKGLPIGNLVREEELAKFQSILANAFQDGEDGFTATQKIFRKGEGFLMGENKASVIYDGSKPVGIRGVIRDVTEKLRTEEALLQSQKMETIGTLAGGLAHDFNNVLSGIIGVTSIMKHEMRAGRQKDVNALLKRVDMIEESGHRAADMVQQLLTLARKQESSFAPVDIFLTIKHVRKICENTFDKSIEIVTKLPGEGLGVYADPTQIEQVLLNLCVNANHAMTIMRKEGEAQGGRLQIDVEKVHPDAHFHMVHPEAAEKDYWVISVSDTGVGMDSATLSKIFHPFFTTKDKGMGTGLGLSMVHGIVHQHGGFLSVYSTPGSGSTFNVYIPVLKRKLSEDQKAAEMPLPQGSGLILLIDDEETLRILSQTILESCGYQVVTAANGEEGVTLFKARHREIRAVLLDLVMPKMSGEQVYLELKKIDPQVRVLLTSGFRQDERVNLALSQGINGFIQKPFTLQKLALAMEKILQNGEQSKKTV